MCVCVCVYAHTCLHHAATASKSCIRRGAKKEKLHSNGSLWVWGGRGEETGERGEPAMRLHFNKQPIKHLTTAGEE